MKMVDSVYAGGGAARRTGNAPDATPIRIWRGFSQPLENKPVLVAAMFQRAEKQEREEHKAHISQPGPHSEKGNKGEGKRNFLVELFLFADDAANSMINRTADWVSEKTGISRTYLAFIPAAVSMCISTSTYFLFKSPLELGGIVTLGILTGFLAGVGVFENGAKKKFGFETIARIVRRISGSLGLGLIAAGAVDGGLADLSYAVVFHLASGNGGRFDKVMSSIGKWVEEAVRMPKKTEAGSG